MALFAAQRNRLASPQAARSAPWARAGLVLGVLLGGLLFAPAHWLAGLVRQASDAQFQLEDAQGTFWRGSARMTLSAGLGSAASASLPGRLHWQIQPGLRALTLQLSADCCIRQAWSWRIAPLWGGLQIDFSDGQSDWPAQLLSSLGTPWNTLAAQGQLLLRTHALRLSWRAGQLQLSGQALLDVQDFSSRLATLTPLGSYRLQLDGGATPALALSTLSGALKLSGQGQWVGKRLRFVGEASARPDAQAALANLLNIIGQRNGARSILRVG